MATVVTSVACEPLLQAAAGCDPERRDADPNSAEAKKVEAKAQELSGEYAGTLTWLRPETTTELTVVVERDELPVSGESCYGEMQGFDAPMKASVRSSDGLVAPEDIAFGLGFDESATFRASGLSSFEGPIDFAALEAAGITPPEADRDLLVEIEIAFRDSNLAPQEGTVAAANGTDQEVVLGVVTFR